jgi:hypothetical protein
VEERNPQANRRRTQVVCGTARRRRLRALGSREPVTAGGTMPQGAI